MSILEQINVHTVFVVDEQCKPIGRLDITTESGIGELELVGFSDITTDDEGGDVTILMIQPTTEED